MRSTAFQRYKYTGDVYKYVRETVGQTSTLKYYFAGKISLIAGLDKTKRLIIRSEQPLDIGTVISDIKDSNGVPILDGMNWQISNISPILNSFNNVESYRMAATKYQGII